jgi:hypothetical protein
MAYKVQLKKLIKIVNPFEHNILKDIKISIEDIESRLNTLDIFPTTSDSKEERIIKEIAYKVANYEQGLVKIRLPEIGEVLEEVLLDGFIDLCAAIYRQEEFLNIELISTPKMAKTLLGIDLYNDQIDFIPSVNESLTFNWNTSTDLTRTWNNPDFIYQKILSKGSFEEGLKLYQNHIPSELVNTSSFAKIFCKKEHILSLPSDWLYTPTFFNIIKSNADLFLHTWDLIYSEEYQAFLENKINIKNHYDKFITLNTIKNEIFNNKQFCQELIEIEKNNSNSFSTVFKFFNENIVYDSFFMNLNYFNNYYGYNRYKIYSLKDIPQNVLNDNEWQNNFIQNFKNFAILSLEEITPIVRVIATSKEKILISLEKNKSLYCIYDLLPIQYKSLPDIIEKFIEANPKVYLKLSPQTPNKEIYLKKFLTEYPSLYTEVPFEDIVALNDKEIFKSLVATDYKILNHKKFPKEFKEDTSVLLKAGANLKYLGDKRIEKLLFKNIDVAKKLCSFDNLFYWKAPIDLRRNPEFALEQLNHNGDIEMYLFASKEFCINALKINEKLADKIPLPYWDDLKFIITLAEFIDAGMINKNVFDFAPPKVREFLDSCNIDSDFTFFFNKIIVKTKLEKNSQYISSFKEDSNPKKI